MTCHWRNNDSDALLTCMGLAPLYTADQIKTYAQRVGLPTNWEAPANHRYNYVLSCLRVNRLIRPLIPEGPCGSLHSAGPNPDITLANKSAAEVGASLAPFTAGLSSLAAGIFASLTGFFGNLFSGAPSALELQTQCSVTAAYNTFADQIEAALASGKIGIQDAFVQLDSVQQKIHSMTAAPTTGQGRDDPMPYLNDATDALVLFNTEVVYPNIASSGSSGIIASDGPLVVGGLFAAKLFGVI